MARAEALAGISGETFWPSGRGGKRAKPEAEQL